MDTADIVIYQTADRASGRTTFHARRKVKDGLRGTGPSSFEALGDLLEREAGHQPSDASLRDREGDE